MKVTFLIGNGFDIGCGMKTRYTDVYSEYVNTPSKTDVISQFKQNIDSDYETWADFEMGMAKYAHLLDSEDAFLTCITDFSKFLRDYLFDQQVQYKNWFSKLPINAKDAIRERMSQSMGQFYRGSTPNEVSRIRELEKTGRMKLSFINFNYTNVFDFLLEEASKSKNGIYLNNVDLSHVNHIHGSISRDMVMGVDNVKQFGQLPYELSYLGQCGFIKPFFNAEYDKQRMEQAEQTIDNSDVLCVFGLSLGDSDEMWRNRIRTWLVQSQDHQLIYYDYGSMLKRDLAQHEILGTAMSVKKILARKIMLPDEIIQKQIHIPVSTIYFNVGSITYVEGAKVATPPVLGR